ncbi:MAG: ornithine carbamoyltransferase [Chloroflexi bacterium RBG_16_50_9]|nr:MAG: ornithine carbamoyltransferase [Chloroflexi bacterium RBG_16_50_9]
MQSKDLLSIADLTRNDIQTLLTNATDMKAQGWNSLLSSKVLVLLFEKPSLRTRVSFEIAMRQLGGHSLYLSPDEVGLGKRESVPDVAHVLGRYASAIAARTFSHQTLEVLARYSGVPVINALSDLEHPCQALADILTIYEKKERLEGLTLAYIGDGNNVAHSLILAASLTGINVHIASPPDYQVQERVLRLSREYAAENGTEILITGEPRMAVEGADVVYTDVWTSMGQEAEAARRRQIFAAYQITDTLLSLAKEDAIFMHPLPAHHGEEVAENILYSPQSVVFDQAENRMHLQKALLAAIMGGLEIPLAKY